MAGISVIQIVGCYIGAHLLLMVAAALLAGLRAVSGCLARPLSYRHLLRIGRVMAFGAPCLPLFALSQSSNALSPLRVQVWAAPSMYVDHSAPSRGAQLDLALHSAHALLSADAVGAATLGLFALGVFLTVLQLMTEARATTRTICEAHPLHTIGGVRLLVSDTVRVPFVAWIPWRCFIIVPAPLLLRPADLRLALRHEVQHHRHCDTRYLYVALLWRSLFALNPGVNWLARQLTALQEFACDEALARRRNHNAELYCACLLRVAEAAGHVGNGQLRAFMSSRETGGLARRIEVLLRGPISSLRAPVVAGIGALAVALLLGLCASMAAPIVDWRLSRAEVERLAANAPGAAAVGLTVNEAVLRQLNLMLGTPDGRAFLGASVLRMRQYEPTLLTRLKNHGLPAQLLAVPFVESGYRNLPARTGQGAGLWMFIAPTARRYGLQVSMRRDQRLDVPAETGAAMQMLSDLWRQFRNWPLALMAYNAGASNVEKAIRVTHSRDAWKLYQFGYGNDPDYLARTTAAMLILAQPSLHAASDPVAASHPGQIGTP